MNDINLVSEEAASYGFIPQTSLNHSENEYHSRNRQLRNTGKNPSEYRRLKPFELEILVKNENSCSDWNMLLVSDPFTPELIKNSSFSGLVRIAKLERICLEHHDLYMPAGITNSRIIACDIGENCAIHDCAYIAHYIIGDTCLLLRNDEIHVSNHAKFGNGILKEHESEEIRIGLDLMNEAGGRTILPFDGMLSGDAYLWARYRGRPVLMQRFKEMTEAMFDSRLGMYGTIGRASVLKSNRVIKDVLIGDCSYVKGTNKLKNLTINSSPTSRTQIGEGVELVNGIIGYGCRIFYGCKAVRFIMCDNSALKYGARLIHSVLGENSTVSCCELLNNLIFPAHEQHHNTSFLIASLVRGQSNMAAGATVGSNHNSRSPDGEIETGRGFWPGLTVSLKHSSKFASFCLIAKGDYRFELDIPLPFCLVDDDRAADKLVLIPAYWWTHNQYALMRNENKFKDRDLRPVKLQTFEYSPFAPDTANEMLRAIRLLELWTGESASRAGKSILAACEAEIIDPAERETTASVRPDDEQMTLFGRELLTSCEGDPGFEVHGRGVENSSRPVLVVKPARARRAYLEMLQWYAGNSILTFWQTLGDAQRGFNNLEMALETETEGLDATINSGIPGSNTRQVNQWENIGGQLVPLNRLESLLSRVESGEIPTWKEMHAEYTVFSATYIKDKARHAWQTASLLQSIRGLDPQVTKESLAELFGQVKKLSQSVEHEVLSTRAKDYSNPFRKATFHSEAEMTAVVGTVESNSFVQKTKTVMETLRNHIDLILSRL